MASSALADGIPLLLFPLHNPGVSRNLSMQVSEANLIDSGTSEHWVDDGGPQPKKAKVGGPSSAIVWSISVSVLGTYSVPNGSHSLHMLPRQQPSQVVMTGRDLQVTDGLGSPACVFNKNSKNSKTTCFLPEVPQTAVR